MKIINAARSFAAELTRNSVGAYSAQAAFFIVISYSPFMLIMERKLLGLAIIPALWAASRFIVSIIEGLNKVCRCEVKKTSFKLRLISVLYLLVLQAMIVISLGLLVLGDEINKVLFLNKSFVNMRWIIGFVLLVAFLTLLYKFVPSRKATLKQCFPGAALSAGGWVIFSAVFSLYVDNFANYGAVYGSLAATVTTMLWLYFCMYIMFAGAAFIY